MEAETTSWIPKTAPHHGVEKWFCGYCGKVTKIEFNPEWIADGKPFKWKERNHEKVVDGKAFQSTENKYDWFVRCKKCKGNHYQRSGFECPDCGWDDTPDDFPIDHYMARKSRITGEVKLVVIPDLFKWNDVKGEHEWDENVKKRIEKKHVIYPIIKNYSKDSNYMGVFISWDETQYCPKHGEFTFQNGN